MNGCGAMRAAGVALVVAFLLDVQYQFYRYEEPSSGGFGNFTAHGIFATIVWALP